MASIYIISGPPGIGKSTVGHKFVPPGLDILNEDEVRLKYKSKGYFDYNQVSEFRFRHMVIKKLTTDEDFALELNLGFESHYEYALNLKHFSSENTLNVVLFFTDDLELCDERAKARFESGGHLVEWKIIKEMYSNTLPLLKDNFDSIDSLKLLDVSRSDDSNPVAEYDKVQNSLSILDNTPKWFRNNLGIFIQNRIDDDFLPKLDLGNPYEPEDDRPRGRKR